MIYNLRREDFETEEEFDDFLEERETIIYNLLHEPKKADESNEKMEQFKKSHFQIIEKRNAQNLDKIKGVQQIQTLPLLGQMKYQTKVRQVDSSRLAMMSIRYSNDNFMSEIKKRQDEWKEKEDVPIGIVGGLPEQMYITKAKEELRDTFFINT